MPKSHSGINRESKQIAMLKKQAKQGEMPLSVSYGNSTQKYNDAFEAINRYYAWPSEEYLRTFGADVSQGWRMVEDREYRPGQGDVRIGTYHMENVVRVSPKNGKLGLHYLYSPIDASPEAREGAMKFGLYAALRQAKVLDKEQFIIGGKK